MNTLYLLQFACCIVTMLLAITLIASRFQVRWPNRHYEVSRWLICLAMFALSVHYVLQMNCGFRAMSDEVGAVINILFYTPVAQLISYATFNVICFREGRRRYQTVCGASYLLILAVFALGYWRSGGLGIGGYLYAMLALFLVAIAYCVSTTSKEIRHHRKIIEEESGEDLLPYDRYTYQSYLIMGLSVLVLVGGIVYRPLLFVSGPLMLFSLIFFIVTFIGYGYNILPMDLLLGESEIAEALAEKEILALKMENGAEILGESKVKQPAGLMADTTEKAADTTEKTGRMEKVDMMENAADMTDNAADMAEKAADMTDNTADMAEKTEASSHADPLIRILDERLKRWCDEGGYCDSSVNMPLLAKKLNVPRTVLSNYFDQCVEGNFRIWLSDLRFQAAQKMLMENPCFNNDTVSAECGFSSHAHLYKIFKAKTGMTPGQWKESVLRSKEQNS